MALKPIKPDISGLIASATSLTILGVAATNPAALAI